MRYRVPPLFLLACLCCLLLISFGCGEKEPIHIGFAGPLTGRHSDLGIPGRNGALLAVEEVNEEGGINGRPVHLIAQDDGHNPHRAVEADQKLLEAKVSAIIGHMTSHACEAVIPMLNRQEVVLLSPTSAASALAGVDDYFFRINVPSSVEVNHLAAYCASERQLKQVVLVVDKSNRIFSQEWAGLFQFEFEKLGGRVVKLVAFTSNQDSYSELARQVLDLQPDGVILICGGVDAAMFCQQVYKQNLSLPIISSSWAMTQEFLQHGGPAVEGVVLSNLWEEGCSCARCARFDGKYRERFGRVPDFAARRGYEAARIILTVLKNDPQVRGRKLKEELQRQRFFEGVHGKFEINEYGDAPREVSLYVVEDGHFRRMER